MNEYDEEDEEKKLQAIQKDNETYLELFYQDMTEKGLADTTIDRHYANANLYLNRYLLNYNGMDLREGAEEIGGFLGEYFIRKCLWSTPKTIKSTAISIKKFYKCMLEHGHITEASYDLLCAIIKDDMEEWQELCRIYNDPLQDNPFSWF